MTIIVNGERREFSAPLSVARLLNDLELGPRGVAVEVNGRLVPREAHAEHVLDDDDEVEVVTLVGGG